MQVALQTSLWSQKHIDKLTTSLDEAAAAQTRVVEEPQALMVQFNDAWGRHDATAEALHRRGDELDARAKETSILVERMRLVVEDAQTLHRDAQAADLTRSAASLRQQTAGDRNKLGLALAKPEPGQTYPKRKRRPVE